MATTVAACLPCSTGKRPKAYVVAMSGTCCRCDAAKGDSECGGCDGNGSQADGCECTYFNRYFRLDQDKNDSCSYFFNFPADNPCRALTLELNLSQASDPHQDRFNACVAITFAADSSGHSVRPAAWGKTAIRDCCDIGVLRRRSTNRKCRWPKEITVTPVPVPDFVAPQPHWKTGNPEDLNDAPFWPTLDVDLMEDSEVAPVRYANGELQLRSRDLAADGFGVPWGHSRIYSNRLSNSYDFGQGTNWLVLQWPMLVMQRSDPRRLENQSDPTKYTGCSLVMLRGTRNAIWFDETRDDLGNRIWLGRFGALYRLTADQDNHKIQIQAPNGHLWEFHDFRCRHGERRAPSGSFHRHVGPGGQETRAAYKRCRVEQVWRQAVVDGQPLREVFGYRYYKDKARHGRVQFVTHFRLTGGNVPSDPTKPLASDSAALTSDVPSGSIQRAAYDYCTNSNSLGNPGDLKIAAMQTLDQGKWKNEAVDYYRYCQNPCDTYCQGMLKYWVGPEGFRRLFSGITGPDPSAPNFQAKTATQSACRDGDGPAIRSGARRRRAERQRPGQVCRSQGRIL